MKALFFISMLFATMSVVAQKPADGVYTYKIAFAEWEGQSLGASCFVHIKGDSIKLVHDGSNLSGKKGDVLIDGVIRQHIATGEWIIANDDKDIYAPELGGCTGGPVIIDFIKKLVWFC